MKKSIVAALLMLAGVCVAVGFGVGRQVAAAQGQAAKPAIVWPAKDIKWVDSPALAGAKIAVLWGDPKTGALAP